MMRCEETDSIQWVGLEGDGDEADLAEDLETVFDIKISNEEYAHVTTLGEAYDIICEKLAKREGPQTRCCTAMAFYRLSRALGKTAKQHPAMRLTVPETSNPKDFKEILERETGFKLDFLIRNSLWVDVLDILRCTTWLAAPILLSGVAAGLAGILIFAASYYLWRVASYLDKGVWVFEGTIGDLARRTSDAHIGQLISRGGQWKKEDIWRIMTGIVCDHTGYPKDRMKPEMTFF
ncbi:hypothetical protein [Coralliovum pocilloporae]|uniref:hypothetical protein n=1 Tax=Coralliovum pocilloporae TaxID=3066369 RepID=UPI003307A575